MKNYLMLFVIIAIIVAAALAIAAPAYASATGSCEFNPQHGWHIVGGGTLNSHWFETEAECLAALNPPTATPRPSFTSTPTTAPVFTPTSLPTSLPTTEPTLAPTEQATSTTVAPTATSGVRAPNSCQLAWVLVHTRKFRAVGYRFFDNPDHEWCQTWLNNRYGIDYNFYKVTHP